MFRRLIAALLLALPLAALPASAQAQTYSRTRLIYEFNAPTMGAILTEIGATHTLDKTKDGDPLLKVTFKNSGKAYLYFRACTEGKKCLGTVLLATFELPAGKSAAAVADALAKYNDNHPPAKAYRMGDTLYLQSYMIADDGITMGNARVQISVFSDLLASFSEALYE